MFETKGVVAQQGRETERAEPRRLLASAPCRMFGVRFSDAQGKVHQTVLLEMGGAYYMPPNSESWTAQLAEVSPWLLKALKDRHAASPPDLPAKDVVDILGAEEDVVEVVAGVVAQT